jgi:hypothetical protein
MVYSEEGGRFCLVVDGWQPCWVGLGEEVNMEFKDPRYFYCRPFVFSSKVVEQKGDFSLDGFVGCSCVHLEELASCST